ncbi:bis(5'-nucleosyl)-tetraphosphatase [Haploplasma modicum]|uniref:bis(5'-nucleosyl)-tetraphosphatase n=1 Tax=Haploplasma modicum TaxID=2150 RepID=UPI00214B2361|nr:NUDIX domain-containing protein [Haploplasma modicum]MCR1808922.1 NUDIX domain-containing protein [Haploplasma modicum]
MFDEYSCGALVYHYINDEIHYLIIKQKNGNYGFPKGHMEENETKVETAKREVLEETGVEIDIFDNHFSVITYEPVFGVLKEVTIFLAKALTNEIKIQEEELFEASWLPFDDARKIITYQKDKNILEILSNKILRVK